MYFAPEIFKKLGTGTNTALLQTVAVGTVNMIFTIIAIWTVDRLGRKPLMVIGAAGMGIAMWALGLSAYYQKQESWVLVFVLGYIACFALSLGPVVWVVLSEIFPTRIRGRAMAIATVSLWSANFVVSQTFPMMNENQWLVEKFHHGFPFWVYGTLCIVTVLFVLLFVPETKRKSLEEIEKMWSRSAE
jgi:SP family xylose:H+ symportor-like MFS transporter